MKPAFLTILLLVCNLSFGQMYSYYNGYVEGYHKACNCNKQIEMSYGLINNMGTWNEGYNAGYVDGRLFYNQNNNQQNNEQLYQPDFNLMYKALEQKQRSYDEKNRLYAERNSATIKRYEYINKILDKVHTKYKGFTEAQHKYIKDYNATMEKFEKVDITIDYNYNILNNWLNQVENEILNWL